ncbi:MAG: ComEC/Rec2 family competence protein [Candidatus Bathyarchaeia archaeon]
MSLLRKIGLTVVGVLVLIVIVGALGFVPPSNLESPQTLTPGIVSTPTRHLAGVVSNVTVHFMDVGQGDAIFIDTNGKDVLVDGGGRSAGKAVVNYLISLNITKIDLVVGTHPHTDHIGGLVAVMTVLNVTSVLDNGDVADTQSYRDYIKLARQRALRVAERGDGVQLDNITVMTVLAPTQPLEFKDSNNNSIVLRVDVGNVTFILTGDIEASGEQSIIRAGLDIDGEILKVSHHGSRTSTSLEFIEAVSPEVAVISVGKGNIYGHPHQETLIKLATKGVHVYRTDLNGSIVISTDGAGYTVLVETPTA